MKKYSFLAKVPGYVTFPEGLKYFQSGQVILITDESIANSIIKKQFPGSEALELLTIETYQEVNNSDSIKLVEPTLPTETIPVTEEDEKEQEVSNKPKRRGTKNVELES